MKSAYADEPMVAVVSPPSRGAWIEIHRDGAMHGFWLSPPSRGAWIEIYIKFLQSMQMLVAPLAGGVD